MVELRYVGKAPNTRTWKGVITGTRYRFGPGDVKWVDKRDSLLWLAPRGDGTRVFEDDSSQGD